MDKFWKIKGNVVEFHKAFYDLGLQAKFIALSTLPEHILDNYTSHERIVQAIIQHSPAYMKKEFPCQRERKLSKLAKVADEQQILLIGQTYD